MRLQGGYTDLKQIFLLSVSIQTHILWYPGPYNWLLFYFYEWYSKCNIVTRDSLTVWILLSCGISINFSQNFFVTLGCFSGCKLYCVTLGCVNSSSWSLPFVWRASRRTQHVESLLKFCFETLIPTGRILHFSCEMLVTHVTSTLPPVKSLAQDMLLWCLYNACHSDL